VSPVRYELGFYIPEDDILHSHCLENLKSYMVSNFCLTRTCPVRGPLSSGLCHQGVSVAATEISRCMQNVPLALKATATAQVYRCQYTCFIEPNYVLPPEQPLQ
jgi:hypothetical protein